MRAVTICVATCNVAAVCAIVYAGATGARWPVPFALFVMVLGGIVYLASEWRRD